MHKPGLIPHFCIFTYASKIPHTGILMHKHILLGMTVTVIYLLSQGCGKLVNVLLKKLQSSTLTCGLPLLYHTCDRNLIMNKLCTTLLRQIFIEALLHCS